MTARTPRRAALAGLLTATALTLVACGGGGDESDDDASGAEGGSEGAAASDELTSIRVGVLPIADSQPIQVGIQEGIFEAHGLDVEVVSGQGGGATLPAVLSGELDFAVGNPVSVLLAQAEGIETRIVSGWVDSAAEGADAFGLVVSADSDIADASDLGGRSVAANTLLSQPELALRESVRLAGGDPEAVELVEIPFPDAQAQLENGQVDAALLVEPFLGQAQAAGHEVILYPYVESIEGGQPAMLSYTSVATTEENPELVEAFRAAVEETMALVGEDDQLVRDVLPDVMDIPQEAADNLVLAEFTSELNIPALERMAELMAEFGFTSEVVDVMALVVE
ncbi:ABC transporter substrate-binding protein [Georgenia sp. Z1491]|uniref:ABC transporter substrate-binding protein n=1 Tax=Georgenia sp. Z1491 TaxID=3416707 RepID=UPI003CF71DD5